MNDSLSDRLQAIPVRARVAIVLSLAQRLLEDLKDNPKRFQIASDALRDAWRWERGEEVTGRELYDSHVEQLAVEGSKTNVPAFGGVISAFYYVMWHAFRSDLQVNEDIAVPNDIADVSEEVIDEVFDYSQQSSSHDQAQLNAVVRKVVKDFQTDDPESLGPVLPPDYFA